MSESSPLDAWVLARLIDHTLLKPDATAREVRSLCEEARHHGFASVCINPSRVSLASDLLSDTRSNGPVVCTVIGFPLGASESTVKGLEAEHAVRAGAREIDMVLAIGPAKEGDWDRVLQDIASVVAGAQGHLVKVILETCLLSDEEILRACQVAVEAGAHFVKTSTGFSKAGATIDHVRLMRRTVGPTVGVKASGGIRTITDALAMVQAGASRIGTSNGVTIVSGLADGEASY